ncbi:MAG TPA: HD domain-containing phosphohydrolase [bacterium]|nr:HD domain-containing phosphohydrolase [bacterium]HPS30394.1 HD domain-containing phosphohydrolase [bacterium]
MTTHPHSRLTHLPLQDVDFPASFAADFISEIVKATEKDSAGIDSYHSWKVCILSNRIGELLGLDKTSLKELFFSSLLHDIGGTKISGHVIESLVQIPDIYGQKNDFFIFAHPHRSETILKSFPTFRKISEIVKHHHEFFDGSGFPSGLKGNAIPLLSRIIRLSDTIDILMNLHKIKDSTELILFLNLISGEEFDPVIYTTFATLATENKILELIGSKEAIENEMSDLKKKMGDRYYFSSPDTVNRFFKTVAMLTDNLTSPEGNHSIRVSELSVQIAYLLGIEEEEIVTIRWAAFLHDIGKLTADRTVYSKKEKLTDDEWMSIKTHASRSYDVINSISGMDKIAYYILHHHENYDGTGYPEKLKLNMIPLGSRIIRVADTFDAMTTNRIYHRKRDWHIALKELKKFSGTQFDPEIVDVFVNDIS